VIFDLEKDGLETIFRPWQLALLMEVLKHSTDGIDSRTAYGIIQASDYPMSRASVINFLNDLEKEGLVRSVEESCKGGHKKIYFPQVTREGLKNYLLNRILTKASEVFGVDIYFTSSN